MFPSKISLLTAGLVLALTLLVYGSATNSLTATLKGGVSGQVERAAGLFLTQNRLSALEFTSETAQWARQEALGRVFSQADPATRHSAAYQAANELHEQIAKSQERRPALVAIVDNEGKVVARDLNPNDLYGDDLKTSHPAVATALSGTANKDVWAFRNRMYRVSCAPIRGGDGRIAGALVVGFEESASDVRSLKDAFGTEVVVFLDGKIYASSFAKGGKDSMEEQALAKYLFTDHLSDQATKERKQTPVFTVTILGESYLAVAAPILGNTSQPAAGFVVLSSLDAALGPARSAGHHILGLGILATLLAMAASLYTSRRFLTTIDQIEHGVSEIINGNHDYVFEKQGNLDFEGLENALNVMVARLLGRPEPSETGEAMDLAGPLRPDSGVNSGPTRLSPENQRLAEEPEESYQRRLFEEYMRAREETGEGKGDMTLGGFVQKLKDNEAALCKKYGTRSVRFKVVIKNNQTTLKPVPLP